MYVVIGGRVHTWRQYKLTWQPGLPFESGIMRTGKYTLEMSKIAKLPDARAQAFFYLPDNNYSR